MQNSVKTCCVCVGNMVHDLEQYINIKYKEENIFEGDLWPNNRARGLGIRTNQEPRKL
jgi:hypothetical protein